MSNNFESFLHNLNKNFNRNVSKQFETYCIEYLIETSTENCIDKLSNKLMNAINQYINEIEYTTICFEILKNFIKYCHKNTRVTYQNKIIHLCELYICYKNNNDIIINNNAIQLLNILYSYEQTVNWSKMITKYINLCRYILLEEQLGLEYTHEIKQEVLVANSTDKTDYRNAILPVILHMNKSEEYSMTTKHIESDYISINHPSQTHELYGLDKANIVSYCFSAYCTLVTKMLQTGCGNGPVILFMPEILDLTHVCLHFISSEKHLINANHSKNGIANEKGNVSILDVSKVATSLKIGCMSILDSVLSTPHPYLYKICDVVYRFIHHSITHECNDDTVQNPDIVDGHTSQLFLLSSVVFMKAMVCYPGSVYRTKKPVRELISHTIKQFTSIVYHSLLSVGNATPKYNEHTITLYFEIVYMILSQYGVMLAQQHRSAIQTLINRSLEVLSKGVLIGGLPNAYTIDRKIPTRTPHRSCEAIRLSGKYQTHLIRLATLDIMVPPSYNNSRDASNESRSRSGVGVVGYSVHTNSHTISMLRYVCSICKCSGVAIFNIQRWSDTNRQRGDGINIDNEAMKLAAQITATELQLDSLLHPVIIPLPYPSVNYQTQECLDANLSYNPLKINSNSMNVTDRSDGGMDIESSVLKQLQQQTQKELSDDSKVATEDKIEVKGNSVSFENDIVVDYGMDIVHTGSGTGTDTGTTCSNTNTTSATTMVTENVVDSDSDIEDLPDIDLS